MTSIVQANDWLDKESSNMVWEGLRTLFIEGKKLSIPGLPGILWRTQISVVVAC